MRWLVRSDVGNGPEWLKLNIRKDRTSEFDRTDEKRLAHEFDAEDEAQRVADYWSDVPGVWHVERA